MQLRQLLWKIRQHGWILLYSEILWVNCHRSRSTEAVSTDSLPVRMRLLWFWLEKNTAKEGESFI